jgi:hypothetical protein
VSHGAPALAVGRGVGSTSSEDKMGGGGYWQQQQQQCSMGVGGVRGDV